MFDDNEGAVAVMSDASIREHIEKAFPFSVKKLALYAQVKTDNGTEKIPTDMCGLFRDDNFEVVSRTSVTNNYTPHTNDDVIALATAVHRGTGGALDMECHWRNGHYITIETSREHRRKLFSDRFPDHGDHQIDRAADIITPRFILKAGYDGKSFTMVLGLYRTICKNLASILVNGKYISSSHRHTVGLNNHIAALIVQAENLMKEWDQSVIPAIQRATEIKVNLKDFIHEIYPEPEETDSQKKKTQQANRLDAILARWNRENRALGLNEPMNQVNRWMAYNAIQGYVQHDAGRHGEPSPFDMAIMALDDKVVNKAAELAFA